MQRGRCAIPAAVILASTVRLVSASRCRVSLITRVGVVAPAVRRTCGWADRWRRSISAPLRRPPQEADHASGSAVPRPVCDAPIRHIDHIQRYADGGLTIHPTAAAPANAATLPAKCPAGQWKPTLADSTASTPPSNTPPPPATPTETEHHSPGKASERSEVLITDALIRGVRRLGSHLG